MGREEQVEEREVLESIFPEEITDISETEFRIAVTLDVLGEEEDEEAEAPQFILQVRYPPDYPDSAPHLDLIAPPNAPSHPDFSVADDREQLLAGLDETIQESLGMAMVFTLVSALKEAAEQLIQDRKDAVAKVREEAALAAEHEENKKFHGSLVTPETFLKWREGFLKEMEEKERKEEDERLAELKKARVKEPVKLSGRQLWERGLAGKGDEGEDEEDGILTEGMERLQVEAA
ncbi:RWD domain-containing protein [Tolypocladium ophioglossoides CBS 100239]|uniref:RWD domain-containing protein n=1 Tax=Tolypocladium ophioglossoides (strain CBS 100239) TaxID=1163406 RepID=A0A0L0N807_TOLOC|nr:RWD domain-containing protein [Tolypocladium ophioglossoides CBS 100239]